MEALKLDYSQLSPFELKDSLIQWAKQSARKTQRTMLDAGRGNPNWVATTPREAFFLLGQFALQESKRVWDEPDLGGMPAQEGIAKRLEAFLNSASSASSASASASAGVELLKQSLVLARSEFGFDLDAFVHELTDSLIADNYPVPDRMLAMTEEIVHRYLIQEMCNGEPLQGKFDLFAVEGGTAAMCYLFNSLVANRILKPGDTIAIGTPIFTPYLEIPKLDSFKFKVVEIQASRMEEDQHTWQYPESEIRKLEDPSIKAFFVVHPSNPGSTAMSRDTLDLLSQIVSTKRPDLIFLTDDVYGTFVPGFRSLAAELPQNTLLVYSYSKHFGCTGWRLGVIGIHQDNIIDQMISRLPESEKKELSDRYRSLWVRPEEVKFIDRVVADSRNVALHHTAGLSLPQQAQMALLSLFTLLDKEESYKKRVRGIVQRRMHKLMEGMGQKMKINPLRTYYYIELDLGNWARTHVDPAFAEYIEAHHNPLDVVFALAQKHGTVLLNGSGFDGPPWSVRVALANLDDDEYEKIGKNLAEVVHQALKSWEESKKSQEGARPSAA